MDKLDEIAKLIGCSKQEAKQFVHKVNNVLRSRTGSSSIAWALRSLPTKRRTFEEVILTLEGKRSSYDLELNKQLARLESEGIQISSDNIVLKENWQEFEKIVDSFLITHLYHFTDSRNWPSILKHNGLYSWRYCEMEGIEIPFPGGNHLSRNLDKRKGIQDHVHLSFHPDPPMLDGAKRDGRIADEMILEIDSAVIYWETTKFSHINATDNQATLDSDLESFKKIKFDLAAWHFNWAVEELDGKAWQAEVMVKTYIPLRYITKVFDSVGAARESISKMQFRRYSEITSKNA